MTPNNPALIPMADQHCPDCETWMDARTIKQCINTDGSHTAIAVCTHCKKVHRTTRRRNPATGIWGVITVDDRLEDAIAAEHDDGAQLQILNREIDALRVTLETKVYTRDQLLARFDAKGDANLSALAERLVPPIDTSAGHPVTAREFVPTGDLSQELDHPSYDRPPFPDSLIQHDANGLA